MDMRFVDLHCDTVACQVAASDGRIRLRKNACHIDLERLKRGGALLQCFALFIIWAPEGGGGLPMKLDERNHSLGPYEFYRFALEWYNREMDENGDLIGRVLRYGDIERNRLAGRMSSLLTIEDGVPLEGRIERVDELYRDGVRMVTLTWNYENSLGYPNFGSTDRGLKPFGIDALRRMNELGIIADVSHLSDAGFYDVAKHATKPFVASHSNARELCPVIRNLTDDMLKILGDAGGVTGLNYATDFLVFKEALGSNFRLHAAEGRTTYVKDIVRHARYIADKAGVGAVALGSDFDGIGNALEFVDCAGLHLIEEGLNEVFCAREVDMITHGNALRVFEENFA